MADLTGQNIQDTYQRVVQVDNNQLQDGTGSNLPISFDGNDVIIPGALRAESYIVSQSTTIATSGSTIFGNSFDDTHKFTGSVDIRGSVNTDYNAITPVLYVRQDGVNRPSIANGFGGSIDFHTSRGSNPTFNGARSGRISNRITHGANTSNDYYAMDFAIRSNDTQIDVITLHSDNTNTAGRVGILDTTPSYTLDVNGDFRAVGNIHANGNIIGDAGTSISGINTIHTTGIITSSGNIIGDALQAKGGNIIGDQTQPTQLFVSGFMTITGNISASANISASGAVRALNVQAASSLQVNSKRITHNNSDLTFLDTGLHVAGGHITASGNISASGHLMTNNSLYVNGKIYSDGAQIIFHDNDGTLNLSGGGGIQLGTNASMHVTASGDISSSGTITALSMSGDGSNLTGITTTLPSGVISSSQHIFSALTSSGDISASGIIISSNISSLTTTTGSLLDSINALSVTTASLLNSVDVISVTTASLLNSVQAISIVTGSYTITGSDVTFGDITASGDISASGAIQSTGNITTDGVLTGNTVTATAYNSTTSTTGYKLNGVKFLWRDGGADLQVGNDAHKTDIIGTYINLQSPVTASGDISASGTGSFDHIQLPGGGTIQFDDTVGSNDQFITGTDNNITVIGDVKVKLRASDHTEFQDISANTGVAINNTTGHITASGNISASGDIRAQTIYGHQFEHFTSTFKYDFDGYTAGGAGDAVFMPISDQSFTEHASSATSINVSRVSVVPGRPIKTTIRNSTNVNLNEWELTCSVFYNQPGQGSAGASPGATNSGQKHLVTATAKGAASNHNAVELDFTNPSSGSWTDLPAGSRMYMTLAVSTDGGGNPGDTTYIVNNLWRWDYSQL